MFAFGGSQRLEARLVKPEREKLAKTKRAPPMDIINALEGQLFFPAFPTVLWWERQFFLYRHEQRSLADFFLLVVKRKPASHGLHRPSH